MSADSIVIEIEGISKDHVCSECGSDDWHINLVVKADDWYFDPDWEMYCPECLTESTCNNLIKKEEV